MQAQEKQTAKGKQQFLCSVIPEPGAQEKFGNFMERKMTIGKPHPQLNKNPSGTDVNAWDYQQLQQAVSEFEQEGGDVRWNHSYPNPETPPPPQGPTKPDLENNQKISTPKQPKNLKSKPQALTAAAKIPQKSPVQKPDPKHQLFLDLSENYISSTTKTVFFALKKKLGLQKFTFG
jgi:hypothetical protein